MFDPVDITTYIEGNSEMQMALGLTDGVSVEIRQLARGEYNQNFVFNHPVNGEPLLFRINLGSQLHLNDQISYEARALRLLESSGRVPRVLYVDDSKQFHGHGILIEEFLPGRPLEYESDLPIAAAILADIHSVRVPEDHGLIAPKSPYIEILRECEAMFEVYLQWHDADKDALRQIENFLTRVRLGVKKSSVHRQRHIVNTELNSRNFLINDDGHGYLVDWEKPLVSSAEQDLAHFLCPTTTLWKTNVVLSEQQRQEFFRHYDVAVAGRFDTDAILKRLDDYLAVSCLRGITWSAMALAEHRLGVRRVADAYTFKKIESYLTKDFLDSILMFFEAIG